MTKSSVDSAEAPPSYCWECTRRGRPCDGQRPVCKTCQQNHIVCPGYKDQKSLTWLVPGKTKSWTWKKNRLKAGKNSGSIDPEKDAMRVPRGTLTTRRRKGQSTMPASTVNAVERTMSNVSVPLVLPDLVLNSKENEVPIIVQYYNVQIYPQLQAGSLGPTLYIVPIEWPPGLSEASKYCLVSMALGHNMIYSKESPGDGRDPIWARIYAYRGLAIRKLNEAIGNEVLRAHDNTIRDSIMFLLSELQHSTSETWSNHVLGTIALIELRGGLRKLLQTGPTLCGLLHVFAFVEVLGYTTSPSAHFASVPWIQNHVDIISLLWQIGYYPRLPCPLKLFIQLIEVNRLRVMQLKSPQPASLADSANRLLQDIEEFSPEDFGAQREQYQDVWTLIARTYRSAVALYCIATMDTLKDRASRVEHRKTLFKDLEHGRKMMQVKTGVLWPMVVAGFEAKTDESKRQVFVADELTQMSSDMGSVLPVTARNVLRRFWAQSGSGWEDCFDKPYAFVL